MTMHDHIAGIVTVNYIGQKLTLDEAAALKLKLYKLQTAIYRSRTIEIASVYLDLMGELQTELATAHYKWKVELPSPLIQLVKEFDRSDDPDLRLIAFNKIKDGTFLAWLRS